jgi:hypothetical protein
MTWRPMDNGTTLGGPGSENGAILLDDQHELGARITLERDTDTAPFAITCGVYGWMVHTRYFGDAQTAAAEFQQMKEGLGAILRMIPLENDPEAENRMDAVSAAIGEFIARFP